MNIIKLCSYIDELLNANSFSDASFNGLQVHAHDECKHIVSSCSASLESIEKAIKLKADTLIVHHGLFWRGQNPSINGLLGTRVKKLIDNKINLLAYHLPLDANLTYGNNASLAKLINAKIQGYIKDNDPQSIGIKAIINPKQKACALAKALAYELDTKVQIIGNNQDKLVENIMICSGSGSFILDNDNSPQFDALITGDINEQTYHIACESDTIVLVLGHHASEQNGVYNLACHICDKFNLKHDHLHFAYEKNIVQV